MSQFYSSITDVPCNLVAALVSGVRYSQGSGAYQSSVRNRSKLVVNSVGKPANMLVNQGFGGIIENFVPKYRRQVIYKDIKADVGQILGTLCQRKGIEIMEEQCMPDHIHMLVSIPPKYAVSEVVGYLKGKSSLMIFEKHANLKYKYGNRHFWCRGYYVDTVGKNTAAIKAYIQNQIKEDLEYDQMSLVEYIDPFTGEPVKKNKK